MPLRHHFINRIHPCWHDVAENVVLGHVKTKLKRRREYEGLVADLKDAFETNALSPNFSAPGCFARLADLAHGVKITGLKPFLVVKGNLLKTTSKIAVVKFYRFVLMWYLSETGYQSLVAALQKQFRRHAFVKRTVVRVLNDFVQDPGACGVNLA